MYQQREVVDEPQSRPYKLIGEAGSINSGEILWALVEETLLGKDPGREECCVCKAAVTTFKEMSALMEVLPVLGRVPPPKKKKLVGSPCILWIRIKKTHSREENAIRN